MKIKTNRVPLVGPRGRKELLNKISELEKKVLELEQGGSGESGGVTSMVVDGSMRHDEVTREFVFTPNSNSPTMADVFNYINLGGVVYLHQYGYGEEVLFPVVSCYRSIDDDTYNIRAINPMASNMPVVWEPEE